MLMFLLAVARAANGGLPVAHIAHCHRHPPEDELRRHQRNLLPIAR